ncbi:beta-ketoacyl-[acyl-carrier-protein] synthase family protein [Enterobacteriaceae bacterium H20N1]|uniref:Beta-ketoacyl-[acyl-carrier-protein] synthase family protein n=1 Tax=Dryocola boscaweniae TaxID=2925397 RepID=A0A9X3AQ10_9ENTR|nr:beta-ketoacyl-[acyl-carrier-protein] synthase family protein [Dryocola boscaweniae]MCT4704271.1 beta-ketoacyl-[acyl-carrier-protein] synthase family protein [Dryocola boscaweniae]MCT4721439.1 beta-ketoacyl-[acyl-carrier-protein] synthase family protein [Dryocola boscaweniae]
MISLTAVGMLNAMGNTLDEIAASLVAGKAPGMVPDKDNWLQQGECWIGRVTAELPAVPEHLPQHNSRNNRLLLAALAQIQPQVDEACARYGRDRVAVVLGTSTSGLDEADRQVSGSHATYHYGQQELGDPSRFLSEYLQLFGPALTISTACSSSARAVITGQRLIESGMVDAAIVGGADTLSRMPINGFNSLESLSDRRCQPFSAERNGITIGEAAALIVLSREKGPVQLLGVGESSDAWHMSAPHPEGLGAIRAIEMAMQQAGLTAADIGYINMHGTATRLNDEIEAKVIHQLFGESVPGSSTKHLTGHTLGAAGACEAALCYLMLTRGLPLPAQDFSDSTQDPQLAPCGLLTKPRVDYKPVMLSNSFAFGGNNAALILGATCD